MGAPTWLDRPVFVVGHPKSGTSLLTAVLDAHPQLVVLPEESDLFSAYFSHLGPMALRLSLGEIALDYVHTVHLRNLLRGQVKEYVGGGFDYRGFQQDAFLDALRTIPTDLETNARNLLRHVADAYHRASCASLHTDKPQAWVEKTAMHTWELSRVVSSFPEARFLAVVRDPRDNYVSFKKKRGRGTPYSFAAGWNEAIAAIGALGGPPRALTLRYEDLVERTDTSLESLRAFLGIDDAPQLRTPSKFGKTWEGNSMFGDKAKGFGGAALGRFRTFEPQGEVRLVEGLTRAGLIQHGYAEHYGSGPSFAEAMRARAAVRTRVATRACRDALTPYWRKWQKRDGR